MARANRGADNERAHALLRPAARLGVGAGVHPEHVARLGGRRQRRARRLQPLLAPRRRDLQVRVRKANRPRRPFTL